ncbi:helix-turn-helix domain-containing protein [Streptomyces sp. NPDC048506]|uniref:helix-turn-helix domain-containing protein n=1 Tax=Streptomyces sp. NPDC048506 TaxID=3155028 RepID=UPI0034182073
MPRQPVIPPDEKAGIVLDLLSGRLTLSQAARQVGVSPQAVSTWRRQFIEAGRRGLYPAAGQTETTRRERELLEVIKTLKVTLGEAHLALRGLPTRRRGEHIDPRRE